MAVEMRLTEDEIKTLAQDYLVSLPEPDEEQKLGLTTVLSKAKTLALESQQSCELKVRLREVGLALAAQESNQTDRRSKALLDLVPMMSKRQRELLQNGREVMSGLAQYRFDGIEAKVVATGGIHQI